METDHSTEAAFGLSGPIYVSLNELPREFGRSTLASNRNSTPIRTIPADGTTVSKARTLMWFRQDLRLHDNPALKAALELGDVMPVYILDDSNPGDWIMGSASRWWLHKSLAALDRSLNGNLAVYKGEPLDILASLAAEHNIDSIVWNRAYEPWQVERDKGIKSTLGESLSMTSFSGTMLWEPWTNLKDDGTPYRVFTPYYKRSIQTLSVRSAKATQLKKEKLIHCQQGSEKIDALSLLPEIPWHLNMEAHWTPGEKGAQAQLKNFIAGGLGNYKKGRDFPALKSVSRLSPHLHFGEVSPCQLWHEAQNSATEQQESEVEHFQREIAWREFSYYLLYHFPTLSHKNLLSHFDKFPWQNNQLELTRWQKGQTGYPLVDAGMRELWQTGYMHNRVRMIVASFLVKNMLLHWRLGADWFWDCLLDADLASNSASWQWVAGSGADAAPYFRIFNPVTQSKKFDASGEYIKRFVPELAKLPDKHIHDPSNAPEDVLAAAGVELDKNYPSAMLCLKETRERALAAYATTRE